MASVKINITVTPELLKRMDSFSEKNSISRSGLISLSVSQYLNALETQPEVNKLLNQLTAAFDGAFSGNITEEEAKAKFESMSQKYAQIKDKTNLA